MITIYDDESTVLKLPDDSHMFQLCNMLENYAL